MRGSLSDKLQDLEDRLLGTEVQDMHSRLSLCDLVNAVIQRPQQDQESLQSQAGASLLTRCMVHQYSGGGGGVQEDATMQLGSVKQSVDEDVQGGFRMLHQNCVKV